MFIRISVACILLLMVLCVPVLAKQNIYLNPDAPKYVNKKYGFSFSLPPGQWSAKQSKDGAEIIIHDGAEGDTEYTLIHAYAQQMPTDDLKKILAEEAKGYKTIIEEEVLNVRKEIRIRAISVNDRLTFIRYMLKNSLANVLIVQKQ